MKNSIDRISRRTQRYWYVDGLAEIVVGLLFGLLSIYFLAQERITAISRNPVLVNLLLFAGVLLVVWLFRSALQAAKARLTYPRTGYVAPPRKQKSSRGQRYGLTAWLVLVCVSLIALALRSHSIPSWAPLLMGVVAGLTVLSLSYRFRLVRFTLLACALVLVSLVVSYFISSETLAMVLSSAAYGVCFLVSGGVTLLVYLHNNPPLSAESR